MFEAPPEDWPNRAYSLNARVAHHHWHIQVAGQGPDLLLLHGAGGSAHSFRALYPLLETDYQVIVPDLPGHGFTRLGARHRSGLAHMAEDIMALCAAQGWSPQAIVGHSAGAAIALQIARASPLENIIGINPALDTFDGLAGVLFPAMAKVLSAVPFTARLFSGASASPARIRALIDSTGSSLDAEGLDLYRRLVARESHVNGALLMMAQWRLDDLLKALPEISANALFLTGAGDRTVPPHVAAQAARRMRQARHETFEGYGHLIHEEAPDLIADHIRTFLQT